MSEPSDHSSPLTIPSKSVSAELVRQLRRVMLDLYPDIESAKRVMDDAAILQENISWVNSMKNIWHAILKEAERQQRLPQLLSLAQQEYPNHPALIDIVQLLDNGLPSQQALDLAEARSIYLNWLIDRNRYLDPRGTHQTTRQVQLKLDEIYISLKAQAEESQSLLDSRLLRDELVQLETELTDLPVVEQEDRRDLFYARLGVHQQDVISTTPIALDTAAKRHDKLVILGDPGSGKTTLLRYLALQNAVALIKEQEGRFPILLRIADYAEDGAWKEHALSDFLPEIFKRSECSATGLIDLFAQELDAGGCLVLLDGLDEIVEADDRRGVVQRIENFIRRYDQGGQRGENRFIVTSRIAGYRSAPLAASGSVPLPHYVVQEMDSEQIGRFLECWCRAVEDFQTPDLSEEARQATAQREIDGIQDAIVKNPGVRRLAGNPLMLRVLALIHRTGARLPQKRIELYKLAAETLAHTWRSAQGVPMSALVEDRYLTPLLGKLAYWIHNEKPTGIATEREVYDVLGAEWARIRRLGIEEQWEEIQGEVDKFLLAVREHTGLFVERAPKRYGFMHLTFEEYYAARHLVARSRTRAQLIRKHLHDSRWEEPILLALGFVGLDYPDEAAELVETAILAQGEEAEELGFTPSDYEELLGRDYLFALRCLGDEIPVDLRFAQQLLTQVAEELMDQNGLACFQRHRNLLSERLEHLQNSDYAQQLITHLLPALNNEHKSGWYTTASLVKMGPTSPEVVAGLLAALSNKSDLVRSRASTSLGQLGVTSSEVVAGLLTALHDEKPNVRFNAVISLGQLKLASEEVVTGLLAVLLDPENFHTRVYSNVVWSLRQLETASDELVDRLLNLFRDTDTKVRCSIVYCLGRLRFESENLVVGLLAALHDDEALVRSSAVISLGKLGVASTEVLSGLLDTLCDEDWYVRSRAVESLGMLKSTSPDVVSGLLAALDDKDWCVRSCAAINLGWLGISSIEVMAGLLYALHDEKSAVRYSAAEALEKLGTSTIEGITALLDTLHDEASVVRNRAAESLGHVGEASVEVITALQNTLLDENEDVGFRAAVSLCQLEHITEKVISLLLKAIHHSKDRQLRRQVAQLVSQFVEDAEIAEPVLLQGLLDDDDSVRLACGAALAQLSQRFPARKTFIVAQLITAIKDPKFEKEDRHTSRTGQDYAHEALWQVVAG